MTYHPSDANYPPAEVGDLVTYRTWQGARVLCVVEHVDHPATFDPETDSYSIDPGHNPARYGSSGGSLYLRVTSRGAYGYRRGERFGSSPVFVTLRQRRPARPASGA